MPYLLFFGLCIALFGTLLVTALFKLVPVNRFPLIPRLVLWVLAIVVLVIAVTASAHWRIRLGIGLPSWQSGGLGVLAIVLTMMVFGGQQFAQRALAKGAPTQHPLGKKLLELAFAQRCFMVITAAVVEEILYRGYAIGIGQHLLGSVWLAGSVSIAAFTLAHLRWGFAHMVPVAISAVILSLLFVMTRNLLVCIIVHAVIDGVGFLLIPALMARKRALRGTSHVDHATIQYP